MSDKRVNYAIIGAVIAIITLTAGTVAAHFMGIRAAVTEAAIYTDKEVNEVKASQKDYEEKTYRQLEKIFNEIKELNNKIVR